MTGTRSFLAPLVLSFAQIVGIPAEVITLSDGSTSGFVLTNGNTYVVSKSMTFSNPEWVGTGSGLSVENNATVVLYIPKGVSLIAKGGKGGNPFPGGGAGILVPETSTIIIAGEGSVSAYGGNGAAGKNGTSGADGSAYVHYKNYGGTGGAGGVGGSGGGGAGAGIGGRGGGGGYHNSCGGSGQSMGTVYVLGSVSVSASSGIGSSNGSGVSGRNGYPQSLQLAEPVPYSIGSGFNTIICAGGGGGGSGGCGGLAGDPIGGGGPGGCGGIDGENGKVGLCPENNSISLSGRSGVELSGFCSHPAKGGIGNLFVSSKAKLNVSREKTRADFHPALQHTISFDANGGAFSTSNHAVTATLCDALPDCIPAPSWPGCTFLGWFTEPFGGTIWYGADGSKIVSSYADPTVTTLYAHWNLPVLRVESQWGGAYPDKGASEYEPGTTIDAWVTLPPERDGVRLEFKGWTGTGSVPASGTGTDVSFTLEEDSTLTWNWECRNRITVSVPVDGQCDFGTQWIEHGTNALATIIPPEGPYEVELRGDINGVSFTGTTLAIPSDGPRTIAVRMIAWNRHVGSVPWSASGSPDGWTAVDDPSSSDGYSLRSAHAEPDTTSTVSATINGAGTLSFDWRISANRGDYCRLYVDGVQKAQITRTPEWTAESVAIDDDGDHIVSWVYDRKSKTEADDNAAYLDNVSWTTAESATSTTPVPVPHAWFDTVCPSLLAACGGDYEAAANTMAANGVNKVWECYVADISPTNETARFVARIEVANGVPRVTPDPNRGDARVYRVLGARTLGSGAVWDDVTDVENPDAAGFRFFKVTVAMPEDNH